VSKVSNVSKASKKKKPPQVRRQERRFFPQSTFSPWLVRGFGGLGATVLGAGAFAMTRDTFLAQDEKLRAIPSYLVAGGAVLTGLAIWLGTSSDPPLRVGAPGIGLERGEVRRMPWWAVEKISYQSGSESLVVVGKDDAGQAWKLDVAVKAQPEAAAWIVSEAQRRIPKKVDISEEDQARLPRLDEHAGMLVELEPLQVVGKRCAASDQLISYEPDARICARCERVYFKRSVPKKCACGASLADLRTSKGQDEKDEADVDEAESGASGADDETSRASGEPDAAKAEAEA
jgi:hypothetical protein